MLFLFSQRIKIVQFEKILRILGKFRNNVNTSITGLEMFLFTIKPTAFHCLYPQFYSGQKMNSFPYGSYLFILNDLHNSIKKYFPLKIFDSTLFESPSSYLSHPWSK